jgi:SAM-dependent methyltransferase
MGCFMARVASKDEVLAFWDAASCGEALYLKQVDQAGYSNQTLQRYRLEPYIADFADFDSVTGKRLLEVGIGLGADFERFIRGGAIAIGVDLTQRAVEHVRARLRRAQLQARVERADAENLPFADDNFDIVYSWGVLHHTPDTNRAIGEVFRVLKPGGVAKIMIYHKYSIVGYMLWLRYSLLRFRPFTSLEEVYSCHLESPGTKAFSVDEAYKLFSKFTNVQISTVLTHGDLLQSEAGQRHRGALLSAARAIWPRRLIRWCLPGQGLFMLIRASKPETVA